MAAPKTTKKTVTENVSTSVEEIKTVESCLNLKVVQFDWGELVTALYVNDVLHYYSDYYHSKPTVYIEAFISALEYNNIQYVCNTFRCLNSAMSENITNYGGSPPKFFNDIEC